MSKMTRKHSRPPMELDLDAFLQSHDTTGGSDDDDQHHHSTVDELLLIDSDDDSCPSSSPPSYLLPQSNTDPTDGGSPDPSPSTSSQLVTDIDRQLKFRSVSQINSGSLSRPLFGAVRSNAKPGAALAAAAAASRSIPTPHAAAIKLRREKSSLDPKASIASELSYESGTGSEISHSDAKLVEEDLKLDNLETAVSENFEVSEEVNTEHGSRNGWRISDEDFPCEEMTASTSSKVDSFEQILSNDTRSSVAKLDISSSLLNNEDDISGEHIDTESAPVSTLQPSEEEVLPVSHEHMDAKEEVEESISVVSEGENEIDGVALHEEREKNDGSRPLKALEYAEELEKKHAFTGLHWEEGAAAQPMKLEGVHRGSTVLGYFSVSSDNTITRTISSPAFRRDHGTPQSLAVHLNYIAVGMSRGVIVVVPSKYSPHYPDNMEAKMLMLGLQGDRCYAPVTAMSFNQQGDLLFAGYADGHYTVWDVQRVSAAKVVSEHKAPVVHMLYLGMDSQVTRQFNVVSGDSKGVVKLIRFSPFSWLNRFSTTRTTTLLDESTSTVVCASPLLSEETSGASSSGTVDSTLAEEGVVIFVTHQSALVAKVVSNTPEVYAQLPKPEGVREGSMPYTAWKYIHAENVQSETCPLLAIAWDKKVQVAKLVKSELKIYAKWTLESSAIGVAWLDDQMLMVLTSAGQLCLYANDGGLIHDTSFAVDGGRGDDVIGHHTQFNNVFGNPEKAHHNCIGVRGASLYLLGPTHLVVSRLLPWKERIEVLRKGGDWMGAFNMAMMLYDGQAHGVFDLPRALENVQKTIMPYMAELLLAYVDEVFSYLSVALGGNQSDSVSSEIKEQYTRVGGVAVEFCVHINRTDILFDQILSRFHSVQQKETFLELLEPYILKDMLGSLPPEIMQALVEHYSTKAWLQRVEQCVLHMDISSLDFNQVVRLCQEHNLYGALIYLFNKGLDDFRTPLEELLRVFRNSNNTETAPSLGYRMLVYLKYCFSGLAFPPGHGCISPARLPSLRMELINLLLEHSNAPSSWGLTNLSSTEEAYKNLYHLLELDTEATLDVLRCAFIDAGSQSQDLIQKTVDALSLILKTGQSTASLWPSNQDASRMLEFISHFVASGEANISKELLGQIFEYLILLENNNNDTEICKRREKEVLALLEVVPETEWDDRYMLDMCERAHFYQVCGFIHHSKHQHIAALDSFMKDVDEPIHAFSYINYLLQNSNKKPFEAAFISRIPDLVQLNREGTVFVVFQHLFQEFQQILVELKSHPKSLFLYLKTVIEVHSKGTLNFNSLTKGGEVIRVKNQTDRLHDLLKRISEFPKFLRDNPLHITDEITEMYLELLCEYEAKSVVNFLETCESYRVDYCLRLCQEHGIIDAAAFLLERVGDVASALSFTLSDLRDKFHMLDAVAVAHHHLNALLNTKQVNDILYIVHTCVGLCQRNSSRLDPNESEALWFQLLDTFCEPLTKMDSESSKWKIKGSVRKLMCIFIKEIVEGMIGYVRLPTVMMKLVSDNGHQEFGDFKATILGMLGTYDFERRILDTAKSLIEDDTYYTMRLLKQGASHGHGPQSLLCCICNCLLTKDTCALGIRVYSCGHASHLHCVPPGTGTGTRRGGCPICMPKKKGIRSTTGSGEEDGLVSRPPSSNKNNNKSAATQAAGGHENDLLDRQISRYEILSNLTTHKEKQKRVQLDNVPPLRLAPPAVYHEKVKKGVMLRGETSSSRNDKTSNKITANNKPSGVRFPLKSNIFGKEKTSRR